MVKSIFKEVTTAHLENPNLIKQSLCGFKYGKSWQLLQISKDVSIWLDSVEAIDVLYSTFH